MPVLTAMDVLGVQRYVFASNRLRDVISASWLVHWVTATDGALRGSEGDVLLASGGNVVVRFTDIDAAKSFAARYTRRLYDDAPGLDVVVAHRNYEKGGLAAALAQLQVDVARAKLERIPSVPQLGISVTTPCRITGLPATRLDPQDASIPLSSMVLRWRDGDVRASATSRWDALLTDSQRYAFPPEIDDMGRTRGDTSLVGVVHIDGNGIGQQIQSWLAQCVEQARPDVIVEEDLRAWSTGIDQIGLRCLQSVVARVAGAVTSEAHIEGTLPDLGFDLRRSNGRIILPLRPVLLGGDDLTFLCDGRLALDLAETALREFDSDVSKLGRVTACAGVAIVPAHTPFDRAYDLAEALAANAKTRRRERNDSGSWIDWHIGAPRRGESVGDLRARSFTQRLDGTQLHLTCRPYRLGLDTRERETWRWLSGIVLGTGPEGFRGERWSRHRNKLKELVQVVREGADGVRRARESWTAAANLPWPDRLDQTGGFFDATRTPLLDAIELLDVHLPLGLEVAP
ncbi:hypothetical protein [Nitrosovibrio sp. Nv17]|uniref:Cas10/Cmr2 second palm domain-containing protein n=1 Tax=Nitrosovibrio sp. Nv17 TaxID=1855339 RepID=UPI0009090703|nr:hypothetical protein [Nitrosovibrio sp. Nv17]SFW22826.1 hypothetical protein SAMN05216414_10721 [Nitrosovibrio sp. Nv17]